MTLPIEDYALIGDCLGAALVGRDGSIDWLCVPRFDSAACFAALLGTEDNGRWLLAPAEKPKSVRRRYRDETLILETDFETESGAVTVVDFMPPRDQAPNIVRRVIGRRGSVPMHMQLVIRFDYGSIVPWVRHKEDVLEAVAGPDTLLLHSDVEVQGENLTTVADFTVAAGEERSFVLTWHPIHEQAPREIDARAAEGETEGWWHEWSTKCSYAGPWREAVIRSLITLKALTYAPTGSIVAAPTTSLPTQWGGERNWDYRYCWLRDATFTLYALLRNGYTDEACAWRDWLLRAVAGDPAQINIMYGIGGERRLTEFTLDWLPGYENARPVRVGNAAFDQLQLDVFGEVMDLLHMARRNGMAPDANGWSVQQALLEFLEGGWREPDEGIWEMRGPRR
ncbi:MAG TPA: glycoside hydrolase family 15 protein, partial [Phycisphaerae bacterium]|nr:glycoside hydrolase family 15 protein [Phycisphaerae bacterium]